MPLTRDFREYVVERAQRDPDFRVELLRGSIEALLDGEMYVGRTLLRDYVNATIGFDGLAEALGKDKTSLMRMLSKRGNPRADNLMAIIAYLKKREGLEITAQAGTAAAAE